ncbi:hypothetical protein OJ253_1845 [Cryptosporidium canis]|uniref:Uncharacterized protein n=1 Tax=Cryptosporidium canis TaxID=195482 RepID=A0A9D5DLL2_9CRYT|nr:hypothetical protein OJ253_1845 [Cryptosporidium canis]
MQEPSRCSVTANSTNKLISKAEVGEVNGTRCRQDKDKDGDKIQSSLLSPGLHFSNATIEQNGQGSSAWMALDGEGKDHRNCNKELCDKDVQCVGFEQLEHICLAN